MENLLASIRQAIDSDLGGGAVPVRQATAASIKGAMDDLRVKADPFLSPRGSEVSNEISELRSKISRNRGVMQEPKTPFAQIMAGQVKPPARQQLSATAAPPAVVSATPAVTVADYGADQYQQHGYQDPVEEQWPQGTYEAQDAAQQEYYQPQLLSQETAHATQSSFNELAEALMARAMGERSIEDMTQELLRVMLRNWLDVHLPPLVERLVREEIERVARRGR